MEKERSSDFGTAYVNIASDYHEERKRRNAARYRRKRIARMTQELERLRGENQQLRDENQELRDRLARFERDQERQD